MIRRTVLYLTGALAAVLVAAVVALAAVPQTMTYQGFLTDISGMPVTKVVNMTFSLYTSSTGTASQVWTEDQTGVAVTNGQYSVVLGSVADFTIPFDVPYYLGVKVGSDAEMTPRMPLTSTGYAFRAAQADGLSSSATLTATNPIVSIVSTGVAPLKVASTTLVQNLNADMVDGMHAIDFLAKTGDTMTGNLTFSSGNIVLPTTTATSGIIMKGSSTLLHTYNGNFFAGSNAGNFTTTGLYNTAIGGYTLHENTTGSNNTAIGHGTFNLNSTGDFNTAIGNSALQNNRSGNYNTAMGAYALYNNTTGYNNTANGAYALNTNSSGTYNTAIGINVLRNNITGYNNTAIGNNAINSNTTGIYNTAIGDNALSANIRGNYNTAIGNDALVNNLGNYNTAIGAKAAMNLANGYYNTAIGYNTYVGTGFTNSTAIGNGAIATDSNIVRIGNTSIVAISARYDITTDSDIRIKKDIQDIGFGLSFIKTLRPVQYRMKDGNERINFGFIGQDIEALLGTDYNVLGIGRDADRMLGVRYTDFIAPMVKAMQEQQAQIDEQKTMIEELKAEISAIKQRLP